MCTLEVIMNVKCVVVTCDYVHVMCASVCV